MRMQVRVYNCPRASACMQFCTCEYVRVCNCTCNCARASACVRLRACECVRASTCTCLRACARDKQMCGVRPGISGNSDWIMTRHKKASGHPTTSTTLTIGHNWLKLACASGIHVHPSSMDFIYNHSQKWVVFLYPCVPLKYHTCCFSKDFNLTNTDTLILFPN